MVNLNTQAFIVMSYIRSRVSGIATAKFYDG